MKYIKTILLLLITCGYLIGQDGEEVYRDEIYLDNISTVFFDNIQGSIPVISKGSRELKLTFDDIEAGIKEYYYRVYHCTKDWEKSDISEYEFTNGINEYTIDEYEIDDARYSDYTTYSMMLPNEDSDFLISGNYIVEIYDNSGDEEVLAITKRFVYAEDLILVEKENGPIQSSNYLSNQELNISLNYGRFPMVSPKEDIYTAFYQNGNWSTGQTNIQPLIIQGKKLRFNVAKPIFFPGIKEFRRFSINGLKFASRYVEAIDRHEEGTDVLLKMDKIRHHYFARDDYNGSFRLYESPYVLEGEEYVNVIFNLKADRVYDNELYIIGKFSNWNMEDKFLMEYDEERSLYIGNVMLKQGEYDYLYAQDVDGEMDIESVEGTSGETLNMYNVIVYYRTLGTDYDRVLAVRNYTPYFD